MKKLLIMGFILLMLGVSACGNDLEVNNSEKLQVMATIYPVYDFTCRVAGDAAEVQCLLPAGSDDHYWEPTSQDIININQCNALLYCERSMESWIDNILPNINTETIQVSAVAEGIKLREEAGEHPGEMHTDPHVWLDPNNAAIMVENICQALQACDPDNAQIYRDNADMCLAELDNLDLEYRQALGQAGQDEFVVSHNAFGYLAEQYGLTQIPIKGLSNEAEPTPDRIAEVVKLMQQDDLHYVFCESEDPDKVCETIAQDTDSEIMVLYTLGSLTQKQLDAGEDYFSIMRYNLENLKTALGIEEING
ncbi:MAG: zinc ABC transporter substrate-binding protein [Clostridia bacterium]|nr:zinc ABC transporter substrate-binding protein [Clostridia bacterium]